MTRLLTLADAADVHDLDLGFSDWRVVDQDLIDRFADATGDHAWIHVDVERARRARSSTIAHGLLLLSLVPPILFTMIVITDASAAINYGLESLRFPASVAAGSRVRVAATALAGETRPQGVLLRVAVRIETDGATKPAAVAEMLVLYRH